MQNLEVSCAVRPLKWSLGVKWLMFRWWAGVKSSDLPTSENQRRGNFKFHGCNFVNLTRLDYRG